MYLYINAAKRCGIIAAGLYVDWMDQVKFRAVESLLKVDQTRQQMNFNLEVFTQ